MRVSVQVNTDKVIKRLNQIPKDMEGEVRKAVETSALLVEGTAKMSIQRGPKSGEIYTHGNVSHQASAPGQPPATDTGALASSVSHWIKEDGKAVDVGTHIEYGRHLEYGTTKMAARPWLFPALESNRRKIEKLFKDVLKKVVGK